eukprot:3275913-Pleurochrysis_carterae.AAC.2
MHDPSSVHTGPTSTCTALFRAFTLNRLDEVAVRRSSRLAEQTRVFTSHGFMGNVETRPRPFV